MSDPITKEERVATNVEILVFLEDLEEHGCGNCLSVARRIISRLRHAEFAAEQNRETVIRQAHQIRKLQRAGA